MSPGITISIHFWRGFGGDVQRDLFFWRYRFGVLTLTVERTDALTSYRKLRLSIERAVERADSEGR